MAREENIYQPQRRRREGGNKAESGGCDDRELFKCHRRRDYPAVRIPLAVFQNLMADGGRHGTELILIRTSKLLPCMSLYIRSPLSPPPVLPDLSATFLDIGWSCQVLLVVGKAPPGEIVPASSHYQPCQKSKASLRQRRASILLALVDLKKNTLNIFDPAPASKSLSDILAA